jgi:hypothetical protein
MNVAGGFQYLEDPAWMPPRGKLLFSEIRAHRIYRLHAQLEPTSKSVVGCDNSGPASDQRTLSCCQTISYFLPMAVATEHVYIVTDPEILGGEPIIKDTRTPVRAVVETWQMGVAAGKSPRIFPTSTCHRFSTRSATTAITAN